jgi:hypothetical protein
MGGPVTKSGAVARLLIAGLLMTLTFGVVAAVNAQAADVPSILSPADGQYVSGIVQIVGTTQVPNFASSELDFAFPADPTQTWFVLQTASLPVTKDTVASWDTTLITDGDYVLRLRVTLLDGSVRDAIVTVRVRNYTPLPTPSPAVTPTQPPVLLIPTAMIIVATETLTLTPPPPIHTPTALPPNPVVITSTAIFSGFWRGALLVGVLVVVFGALVRLRR